ncbi:obscurin-like [Oppia nitens]|uniref:obscurin-like n=1 Tax=Oppia nitens TaxID=1686743 RepID=UPI0023DA5EC8|nr:obscurin-like [Oppia nitens]XP_054168064.1 obscurin-like [Oppia nitens]XP_054168065.1 obscurin-like [Oppia nitens]
MESAHTKSWRTSHREVVDLQYMQSETKSDMSIDQVINYQEKYSSSGTSSPKFDSRPTSPGGSFLPHPPMFKVKLKDTELLIGTTIRFELVVRGMPVPTVTFYKDDEVLKEDKRMKVLFESKEVFELVIEHITEADAGVYKCVAINSEGKDETSGTITVSQDKDVFPGIEDDDYSKSDSMSPRSRSPVFKWFKDGKEFEASERFQVQFDEEEDTVTLVFQHVKPDDASMYTCAASTSSGKISCSAELTVQGRDPIPPTIKLAMSDVEVSEGASAMLEAKVMAYPRPTIRWFKGSQLIESSERYKYLYEDEESYTLVVKNTRKDDEGVYRLEAVNEMGRTDTSAKLIVNVSPKFKKQMKEQSVMTDECLNIEVEVEANPMPDIKWFKDGQQIRETKNIKILNEKLNVYNLVIERVRIEDSGSYSCVASNELGQQTTYNVVTVNAPPVFKTKLQNMEVLEGQRAELTVHINGNPKPNIKFTKDEKEFKKQDLNVEIIDDQNGCYKLVINESNLNDSGKYKCIATNDWGEESSEAQITIKKKTSKPNFIKKLRDCEAKEGDQHMEFNVKVDGMPKPEIKWYREGLEIKERDGYKYVIDETNQSYSLIIIKVDSESAGTYKCEASNSEGSAQTSGLLTVNTPPQFIKKLDNISVDETQDCKLEVKVIGCPTPSVNWFKGETRIETRDKRLKYEEISNEYTLSLKGVTKEDESEYKIIAENVFGKCETKAKVTVVSKTTKPMFTKKLIDKEVMENETNIEFYVKTNSQSIKPTIDWYIDGQEIKKKDIRYEIIDDEDNDSYRLRIKSANDDSVGRYKCVASNSLGSDDTSAEFTIVKKPKFVKNLDDTDVLANETIVLEVIVSGCPAPEVMWFKDEKKVNTTDRIKLESHEEVYQLKINNASLDDTGVYKCRAKNKSAETESKSAKVNVTEPDTSEPPVFVKHIADSEVVIGDAVRFEAKIDGKPTPEVLWTKNGVELKPNNNIKIRQTEDKTYELIIKDLAVEDTGDIVCKAQNTKGVATDRARLKVQEPESPTIVSFADLAVVEESPAKLEAKITGIPKPIVSWYKDSKPVDEALAFSEPENNLYWLQFNSVTDELCGKYVCNASNIAGEAQTSAELSVSGSRPKFLRELEDTITMSLEKEKGKLVLGQNAVFEAEIVGNPIPKVSWIKDGVAMVPNDRITINSVDNLYTCEIKSVARNDVAQYVCKAVNPHGEVKSVCLLKFQDTPHAPIVKKELPKTVAVEEGTQLCLLAQLDGEPIPSTQWFKNGKPIAQLDDIKITDRSDGTTSLIVEKVTPEYAGEYSVKAKNLKGEITTSTVVSVEPPKRKPSFDKELPKQIDLEEKQPLTLSVKVDGHPTPEVKWTKDGSPLRTSNNVIIEQKPDGTQTLKIIEAKPEDTGSYSLRATNISGQISCSTAVKVSPQQIAPVLQKKLSKKKSIEAGEPIELVAKLSGEPIPDVKWLKNGVEVKESDGFKIDTKPDGTVSLKKQISETKDSGNYELVASNSLGKISSATAVDVKPVQNEQVFIDKLPEKVNAVEGQPLLLSAKLQGSHKVEWTKDGKPLKPSEYLKVVTKDDGTIAISIETAKPQHSGQYAVIIKTPKGDMISSSDVNVISGDSRAPKLESLFPKIVDVIEGKPLILKTKVDGQPLNKIVWLKDDIPIKETDGCKVDVQTDGTIVLNIDKAKAQDSGRYTLIVENALGEVRAGTNVDVQKGPIIAEKLPEKVEVIIGEPLKLIAKVDGQPLPKVEWAKDGVVVKQGDGVKLETQTNGTVALNIDKTKTEDSGAYALIVKSSTGDIVSSTKVDVQKGPIILDKLPEYVDIIVGKALKLATKIVADSKPEVKWTKDGVPIQESENIKFETKPDGTSELIIQNAQPLDTGKYAVIATTPTGLAVSGSDVDVQFGPIFMDQLPESLNIVEGKPVNLFARVEGNPMPDVNWTKDGVDIKPSDSVIIKLKPDGAVSLVIESSKLEHTGKYALIAKNPVGNAVSITDVSVEKGPIIKDILPQFVNISEGQPLILVARSEGTPIKEIKWTKNGVPIKPSDAVKVETTPSGNMTLTIDKAQVADAGKYELMVKTPTQELKTTTDVNIVKSEAKSPELKTQFSETIDAIEGKPLILTAKVDGEPTPEVKWHKDGVPIQESDNIKIVSSPDGTVTLSVNDSHTSDSGVYSVVAENAFGETKAATDVMVQKGPVFTEKLTKSKTVVVGHPLVLTAKVEGQPTPQIQWTKDGVPIKAKEGIKIETKPDGTVELSVDKAKQQDSGEYVVIAKTSSGDISSSSKVDVQKGPIIVDKLPDYLDVIVGKPLHLSAKIDGVPQPIIKWTKDGNRIEQSEIVKMESKPDGTVSLDIDCAQSGDLGKYAVIVKNNVGESVSECDVDVQYGPIIMDKLPDTLNVCEGNPFELIAKVDGNPMPETIWTKDGLPVEPMEGIVIKSKPDGTVALCIDCAQNDDTGRYGIIARSPSGEVVSKSNVNVEKGPIVKQKLPQFVNINEEQPLILKARIEGKPIDEVFWTKDDNPIKASDRVKLETKPNGEICLTIDNAKTSDTGKYALIVKTPDKDLKTVSDINVVKLDEKRPQIVSKFPDNVDVVEGKPFDLKANIGGQPKPVVQWLKDGIPLKASDHIKFETKPDGSVALHIENSRPEDSGKYTLIADNPLGEMRASTDVDVQKGPVISEKLPECVDVVVGKPLLLKAKIEGEPKPEIAWTKDGIPVKEVDGLIIENFPDGTVELTIEKTKPENTGQYTLIAKSPTGEVNSVSNVDVLKGPIVLVKLPENIDVIGGKPLNLTAKVDAQQSPLVKWTKDGIRVVPDDHIHITSKPDGTVTLDIDCAQLSDTAKYAVIAKTRDGEDMSSSNVFVTKGPVIVQALPESITIVEGKPLNLIAKFDGQPIPETQWFKDNRAIKPGNGIEIKTKSDGTTSLSIVSAQEKHSGEYAVIAKSPSGETMSLSNIEVKKGPVFTQKLPEAVRVVTGKPVKLVAKIDGLPQQQPIPPIINWVKDGYPVRFTEKIKFDAKPNGLLSLNICSALPKDSGKYTVIAKTPEGEIKSVSLITVKNPPIFVDSLPKTLDVVSGKPFLLTAKFQSDTIPEIVWTKDGIPLKPKEGITIRTKPDGTVSLEISDSQIADSGQYAVMATNDTGEAKSSCDVFVQKGLIIVDNLPHSVTVCEGKPLTLSTKIDGKPLPEVTWIKDGMPIKESEGIEMRSKPDGTYLLTIASTKPSDSGEYVMIARIPNEEVVAVTNVSVEKGPVLRERLPERVHVIEGKPLILTAKIESEGPVEKIIWTKDGVPLKANNDMKFKIRPDGSICLKIESSKLSDAGKYAVFAKSGNKGVGSMSMVTVEKAPEEAEGESPEDVDANDFKEKLPKSLTVTEGSPLKLVAKIARKGDRLPPFKWVKDGVEVEDTTRVVRESTPNGTVSLKIENSLLTDAGNYILTFKTPDGDKTTTVKVHVNPKTTVNKPVFIKGLIRVNVDEGKSCRLECKVSGDMDSVKWFKDGQQITPNEHFGFVKESDGTIALLIDVVKSDDSAEYSVEVTNKSGKADTTGTLKVIAKPKEKPTFIEELKPIIANERQSLILKAIYKSDLPVTIKWMKDGFDLKADNRIKISDSSDGTVTLTIESAKLADSGKYSVSVVNDEGRARSNGTVTVGTGDVNKPIISDGLQSVTFMAGEPGKLSVRVTGEPVPDIRFIKDGQQVIPNDRVHIKGQPFGRTELVFDEVRPEDEGNYIVVAANECGEDRSSAPVVVNRPPKFDKPLSDTTGIEGYPVKLETKLDGRPEPDIKWTKNGQTLKPDDTHIKLFTGNDGIHTILFDNCSANDSGTYGAIAGNEFGETETSAVLTVKSKSQDMGPECAPIFIGSLQDVVAYEGQTIDLFAEINANPIPDIKWYFNGQEITASDQIIMSFDGKRAQLRITRCKAQHKGVYELKVTNSLGETSSKASANVLGKSAPKFIEKFTDAEVGLTEPTKLVCRVIGFPEPDIDWYCNGNLIEPGLHYSIIREGEVCSLVVIRANDKMTGVYECRASNMLGSDNCKANIKFIDTEAKGEAASFLKKLGDYEVREGKTARFTACVTGSPKPEIKWFKDGTEFDPLTKVSKYSVEYLRNGLIRFEIRSVEASDLGEYRCHAMNVHGYDNSMAQLKFESMDDKHRRRSSADKLSDKFKKQGVPVPLPDRPRIIRMTDNDVTLSWLPSVPIQPRIPVTYIIEFCRIPDGEWIAYRTGIQDNQCTVDGMSPGVDYSFRTRVENKFGISDPSPAVTAYRSKLRPSSAIGDRKPRDFDLDHPAKDKNEIAPIFLGEDLELTIYGIRGEPVTLEFYVYAHPDATIVWQYEGNNLQTGMSTRYETLQDRAGQNCLFLSQMTEADVGWYTCIATNVHGKDTRKIKLLLSEAPVFTKRFDETTALSRRHARFECTVVGIPEPTVRWFKDWQPMHESDRIKILWESPDRSTLFINGAIVKDAGLYSCLATNIAGHASVSAMLYIEESELEYDKYTFGYNKFVKPKTKPFETYYDIGDELGRGTQGITYHSVERSTGKSFASKMMHSRGQMKEHMMSELEVFNQLGFHPKILRLWDAFQATTNSLTLVTDLCGGGELLKSIVQKGSLTENEVAYYIRQILEGLDYLHFKNIAHFGLNIGDILLERVNGSDIKIADFGLAQRLIPGLKHIVEFGHPEFVAPEILEKQSASYEADVWSAGIITYLLLTGISPFLGDNDRATLQHLKLGNIDFSLLTEASPEATDFIQKLLERDQYKRFSVKQALQHPWLRLADRPGNGNQLKCIDNLRQYYKRYRNWYTNASCKTHYRRRALHSCFTHPSRMIYPPDEQYTPPPSPERETERTKFKPSQFDETYKQRISREAVDAQSESQYQTGPDTYLLQLRDSDFATRIRQYLRVGASRSPSLAASLRESHWGDRNGSAYKPVSVRERRKFTDIMDEEIGEEKKGLETRSKPMRLVREIGTSGYAYGQLHHLKKEAFGKVSQDLATKGAITNLPFFREKLKDITIKENEDVVFSCLAVGTPTPVYTWFRNDGILIESSRIEVKRTEDGRCELRIKPARAYDIGQYKCVARNEAGAVVCRARLKLGDSPGVPDPPEIKSGSNKEIYLCWSSPKQDGNSHILCYRLEYKKVDDQRWTVVADNIMHEFYIMRDLEPETTYCFRISAKNRFGWSAASLTSEEAKTQSNEGAERLLVPRARINRQTITEDVGRVIVEDRPTTPTIDYNKELNPIPLTEAEHNNLYDFIAEISRGRFSVINNTRLKDINKTLVSKAVLTQSETESGINNEYEIMKTLANERIAELYYASRGQSIYALVMEKLSGIDVLTYLSQRQKYNEEIVSKIIIQVLDGIEYLHFRGICILELQPDNVVMIDQRRHDIKLVDFANARHVPIAGTRVSINASPEFVAPELIKNEEVTNSADIWCVGVLTYILLSGFSPFRGSSDNETAQNVVYVRYLFDHLYPEITQEAIRFLLTVFKLTPHKRPTIEECSDHKWLLPNEFMVKKRENAIFSSHKLTEFADQFHSQKSSSTPARLLNLCSGSLDRSVSLQNDTFDEL